jgi:hypothetical protein
MPRYEDDELYEAYDRHRGAADSRSRSRDRSPPGHDRSSSSERSRSKRYQTPQSRPSGRGITIQEPRTGSASYGTPAVQPEQSRKPPKVTSRVVARPGKDVFGDPAHDFQPGMSRSTTHMLPMAASTRTISTRSVTDTVSELTESELTVTSAGDIDQSSAVSALVRSLKRSDTSEPTEEQTELSSITSSLYTSTTETMTNADPASPDNYPTDWMPQENLRQPENDPMWQCFRRAEQRDRPSGLNHCPFWSYAGLTLSQCGTCRQADLSMTWMLRRASNWAGGSKVRWKPGIFKA